MYLESWILKQQQKKHLTFKSGLFFQVFILMNSRL